MVETNHAMGHRLHLKAQTKDEKQWGNAQHIALSCKIWRIRILVHHEGFGNYEFGEEGTQFHILYSGEMGTPQEHTTTFWKNNKTNK